MHVPSRAPPDARTPLTSDRARMAPARWESVLGPAVGSAARTMARDVIRRLGDFDRIERAVESAKWLTSYPRSVHWRPEGLWQGHAGLALLFGAADACLPDEGFDVAGRDHLTRAVRAAEGHRQPTGGLSTGLAGLAVAASSLSRDGARYRNLLRSLDAALVDLVEWRTRDVVARRAHGTSVSTFDVISGLTGVGRYLLARRHEPGCRRALESVLRSFVYLAEDDRGVPHWYTAPSFLTDAVAARANPDGNLNLGLAHGVPGPLSLLSLAANHGVTVAGQTDTIRRIADLLCQLRIEDTWGPNWPTTVTIAACRAGTFGTSESLDAGSGPKPVPSRTAWCYGNPGIARSLWLAGVAVDENGYRDLAVAAMEAVYRRPPKARQIDSPTFCHGVAGLQQITLRFANESGRPLFEDAAHTLHAQLVDAYEPESLLGFRNLEPGGARIDQPGLLDGAAGVALVLLAASSAVEPTWDLAFLLS